MQANKVLVPVNGADCDEEALWLAQELTRETSGKIFVLYVIEVQRSLPLDAEVGSESVRGETVLQRMESLGAKGRSNLEAEILQARDAGPAVVQEAVERSVDVIVLALPYKHRYGMFSLGNTVPYILKNAPCPVLLSRQAMAQTPL